MSPAAKKSPAKSRTTPPPPPSPSDESEAASSAASSAASETSSGGFIDDSGPAFDAEAAAAAAQLPHQAEEVLPPEVRWETDAIEPLLMMQGRVLHAAIGVAEQDWIHTELDLAAIAPPLARILNRYDASRALAAQADPIVLAAAFGAYMVRSLGERRDVLREFEPEDVVEIEPLPDQPINGAPAPAPAGTPPAPPAPPTGSTQHTAPAPAAIVTAEVDPADPDLEWKT